jgi:catechol 2,3-dioxygenase-like lactoylglutathione lyase family enzyme
MDQRFHMTWAGASASVGLAGLLSCSPVPQTPQTSARVTPPIRRIDHIMIRTGNPHELYTFFTETLQLPVAWRLTSPRAGVTTGGVSFGNVNVEAIQFPGQKDPQPRLVGLALEPASLADSITALARRGVTLGEPRPLIAAGADGTKKTLWTNVTLRPFSDSDGPADATMHIFLSEYSPAYVNVEERRARLRKQLAASGGGPLGVIQVKEVVVGASDMAAARRLWQSLLDPIPSSGPDSWSVGDGPAIRLAPAAGNRIMSLVVRVASLERAATFLRDRHLLRADPEGGPAIDLSMFGGLDIRLVDK